MDLAAFVAFLRTQRFNVDQDVDGRCHVSRNERRRKHVGGYIEVGGWGWFPFPGEPHAGSWRETSEWRLYLSPWFNKLQDAQLIVGQFETDAPTFQMRFAQAVALLEDPQAFYVSVWPIPINGDGRPRPKPAFRNTPRSRR